ncbi:hypothetical protein ACWCP6_16190 [Streptomyces sp. NPDC002004]
MPKTPASAPHRTAPSPTGRTGLPRRALRAVAIVSCLPYLALKIAWIGGSHLGIPDGSVLLEHRAMMVAANSLTVLMDGAVILLSLVLTRPWGMRVPAWLLAVPMWIATGLLTPIMIGFPAQLAVRAVQGSGGGPSTGPHGSPFLAEWVFGVVYTGFIAQGLALGALFVLYARDRWSHLWRGRVWELPAGRVGAAQRATAVAAALFALYPVAMHVLWALGSTAGLGARPEARTSDFSVVEATHALCLVTAVAGALLLAFRRGRAWPVKVPLALGWAGTGAAACWGAWTAVSALGVGEMGKQPSAAMVLTYAVQMIVGILGGTVGAYFFAERASCTATAGCRAGSAPA